MVNIAAQFSSVQFYLAEINYNTYMNCKLDSNCIKNRCSNGKLNKD